MKRLKKQFKGRKRGGVLISALVFTVVISMLLAGIGTLSISHYARAKADLDYANALDLAEAGANYEFNKISKTPLLADVIGTGSGATYPLGNGNFSVYVTNRSNSAWTPGTKLYVYSKGTVNGITRTIRVSGKVQGNSTADYALFSDDTIIDQAATVVAGDIGTNTAITLNNGPTITGYIDFNGPSAGWSSTPSRVYSNVRNNAAPVVFPTVDALATQVNASGLTWIAAHNDNYLASPSIGGTNILTNVNMTLGSKAGGANYYLTGCTCNGSAQINFDNSQGPINVWVGPTGSNSTFVFNGGAATVQNANDSTKKIKIYSALNSDVIFNCTSRMDFGVYAYNTGSNSRVIFNNNPKIYGTVIANKVTLNQSANVYYQPNYFNLTGTPYYGYDDAMVETNTLL